MIWIPIISEDKIYLEECEQENATLYNYLPNEEGLPIIFDDFETAQTWVNENVKPECNATLVQPLTEIETIRAKYLKV